VLRAPRISKDGVTVAKEIELSDRFENIGAQLVKQVALRTSELAGDGTTAATLLAQAIVKEGAKVVGASINPMDIKRGIEIAVNAVVADILKRSRKVSTNEEIAQIGTISANGDTSSTSLSDRLPCNLRSPSSASSCSWALRRTITTHQEDVSRFGHGRSGRQEGDPRCLGPLSRLQPVHDAAAIIRAAPAGLTQALQSALQKLVERYRQLADAPARGVEYRIGNRRSGADNPNFTEALCAERTNAGVIPRQQGAHRSRQYRH
jgi:hypothetical protein